MPTTYITFAQSHEHLLNGKTFDKNCEAAIESDSESEGREIAFGLFSDRWHRSYFEEKFTEDILKHFYRGVIDVD